LAWERKKYEVSVNRTTRTVIVKAGKKTILETGTLVVGKTGADLLPLRGQEEARPVRGTQT
jgi:hypothetical protein